MPDRGGRRAQHRLCDSVSGANWRSTRFEDERTVNQYACCVCHVIPSTTVLLPCSHILCEQCVTGCAVQDGGSVCALDAQPFCEDECQKLKLPAKTKHNLKFGERFSLEAVMYSRPRKFTDHTSAWPKASSLRQRRGFRYVSGDRKLRSARYSSLS